RCRRRIAQRDLTAPQGGNRLPGLTRRVERETLQQHAIAFDQLEVEPAVGLAVLLEGCERRFLRSGVYFHRAQLHARQVAQAHRLAQLRQQRCRITLAQPPGAVAQRVLDVTGARDEREIALAQRRDFALDEVEQLLLGIA